MVTSTLLVKLHINGKKAGFAYGGCRKGRFFSSRIEMTRGAGKGACKHLYSYYLRCATVLDSVHEFTAVMFSYSQKRICSCMLGAMRLTFGDDAVFQCFTGGMNSDVDEEHPLEIGHDLRAFCNDADLWGEITVRLRPAHGRGILVPRGDSTPPMAEGKVYSEYFTYFQVSPHACRHRRGACASIPPHVDAYIHSRVLLNSTTLGEVFSTAKEMRMRHWPIIADVGAAEAGVTGFDPKYGYKLLKYHFVQVCRSQWLSIRMIMLSLHHLLRPTSSNPKWRSYLTKANNFSAYNISII